MGAQQGQIVGTVFGRAAIPPLVGVVLGSLIATGLASCLAPVRRTLAVEPVLAMKSE